MVCSPGVPLNGFSCGIKHGFGSWRVATRTCKEHNHSAHIIAKAFISPWVSAMPQQQWDARTHVMGPPLGRHAQLFLPGFLAMPGRNHCRQFDCHHRIFLGRSKGFRKPEVPAALPQPKKQMARTTSSTPNSGTAAKAGKPRATRGGLAGAARRCFSCSLAVLPAKRQTTLNELLAGGTYYKHKAGICSIDDISNLHIIW